MLACRDTPRGDTDGNPIFYDCLTFSNRAQGSFVSKWDLTGQAESILSDSFVLMKVKQGYNVVGGTHSKRYSRHYVRPTGSFGSECIQQDSLSRRNGECYRMRHEKCW